MGLLRSASPRSTAGDTHLPEPNPTPIRNPYLLRLALGLVYLHFGILKLFPDLSPAEMLATQTIIRLSWSWLDAPTALFLLAAFEISIGIGFLLDIGRSRGGG